MSATALSFWWVFSSVNHGDYIKAVLDRNLAENITRVLYPNDNVSHCHVSQLEESLIAPPSMVDVYCWCVELQFVWSVLFTERGPITAWSTLLDLPSFVLSVIDL